jgi:hypothetical protein
MYLTKILILSLSVYCITLSSVYAQRDSIRVRVFNASESDYIPKSLAIDQQNYVSINPYLLLRGAFTINYEQVLTPRQSIVLAGGLTYRDFIYELGNSLDDGIDFEGVQAKVGTYYEVAYKFYPKGYDDFDGFYLSPGIIGRSYSLSKQIEYTGSTGSNIKNNVNVGYKLNEAFLKFGYVSESWMFDEIITDFYFGVGMRQGTFNTYELIDNSTSSGQYIVTGKKGKVSPCVYLGVKIGMSW